MNLRTKIFLRSIILCTLLIISIIGTIALYVLDLSRSLIEDRYTNEILIQAARVERLVLWEDSEALTELLELIIKNNKKLPYAFVEREGLPYAHTFEYGVPRMLIGRPVSPTPVSWYFTSFKIYLRRVREEAEEIFIPATKTPVKGSETVLLAEDEHQIRKLIKRMLEKNGYKVLEAENGGSAYLKCKKYEEDIHLLLTDVVMPEMNGNELYEQISTMKPGIKVLYMSGHIENTIVQCNIQKENAAFIQKPFEPKDLINKLREVLEG